MIKKDVQNAVVNYYHVGVKMLNERKNILFLDMDGVVNSNYLLRKWFDDKFKEIKPEDVPSDFESVRQYVNHEFYKEFKHGRELIFPELAQRLNEVINTCNVKLIWSSTWRCIDPYETDINCARAMLERRGINGSRLIGYTPSFTRFGWGGYNCRISEILSFVKNNTYGITFDDRLAAIDDANLSELESDDIKFFGTEVENGITEKIKNDMIEYFNS